ncbi:hypothetical protein MBM_05688 [Drepanopeziza brunnea f. sp. 'multigermtubi' MB_m1]|uniref:Major facilitator superfamily (MFS) profile domain-containing protein n=1 Tax=Marssonina brunnea f. sp. multigermtubi (strain MB_m1) TaxID=1072389 RepID=K1XUI9_MARBU|nr:uncharacterized protein MBM_05688 [Drepanopeziza brunnea f. sp. 'multigermtubi' MB_m1]EKD16394.1 hypothetical protein MBM_05688 [Drepanopeziza brunnea f. sp. 'multigermtubi' MB_m1]
MAGNSMSLATREERRPWLWEARSSTWFIVLTVSSGVFTDMFLYGVIIPVIPDAVVSRANVAPEDRQDWVAILLVAEAITYLATSPLFGLIADRTRSRKIPYLTGLILLSLSLAIQTVSHSTTMYMIGRALQGASAAAVWVVGLAIVCDTVSSKEIGKYMGYVSLAISVGELTGPLLGGVVYEYGGYYSVFGMGFAVLGIDAALRGMMIERKVAEQWLSGSDRKQADAQFGTPTVVPLLQASPSETSESSMEAVAWRTKSSHTGGGNEEAPTRRKKDELNMLSLLKIPHLLFTLWACMVPTLILAAFESTLPITVFKLFNWSSLGAGLIFIPLTLPSFLSPITGALSDTYGCRLGTTFGFLGMVPPLVCLRFVEDGNTLAQKMLLCVLLAIVGVMMTLVFAPTMAEVERIVAGKEAEIDDAAEGDGGADMGRCRATAYALLNMAYAVGILGGPVVGASLQQEGGLAMLGWVLGLMCVASAVSSFLMVDGWIGVGVTRRKTPSSSSSSSLKSSVRSVRNNSLPLKSDHLWLLEDEEPGWHT